MVRLLNAKDGNFAAEFEALLYSRKQSEEDVAAQVKSIIADVRTRGDDALVELTNRFDHADVTPGTLRLSPAEMDVVVSKEQEQAIATAASRIEAYHKRQVPEPAHFFDDTGAELGWRWTPVDSVGLYVPGGTAAYPSSVLMNAIPARVAGVKRLVMVTPASGGKINPLVLAAAKRAGITEVYRVGGAQAIAALAYGTMTIAPVDKIVGPGNAYVAAAKRRVFGRVGIDMIAGPSEILVVADRDNDPVWIAADLLSQCEHDTASQAILITDDERFASNVAAAVERHLQTLARAEIARESWQANGAIVVVSGWGEAAPLVDRVAPEHLELAIAEPEKLAAQVRHAGAIFLGRHTPEAIGDYVAGPNHVLPTARSARFASGLGVLDFMKRTTSVGCDPESFAGLAPSAIRLAEAEGLGAHALSLSLRLGRNHG